MKIKIAPSILSADFGKLNQEISDVDRYCDLIHVDVMDGHFVPNITLGAPVVAYMKSKKPLDVHLMIDHPEEYIDDFAKAGAKMITFHEEAVSDLKKAIKRVRDLGLKVGVSIKPKTPVSKIKEIVPLVDLILVMTVEPGFGGQKFMENCVHKISELRKMRSDLDISVDGGINEKTAKIAVKAGANILVAGSYIFGAENRKKAIESLRG